jgi:hypothetical protein
VLEFHPSPSFPFSISQLKPKRTQGGSKLCARMAKHTLCGVVILHPVLIGISTRVTAYALCPSAKTTSLFACETENTERL